MSATEIEDADDLALDEIDLHEAARELTRRDQIATVDREVDVIDAAALGNLELTVQLHRLGVPEVEAFQRFGHDDGLGSVRREVEVVRVLHALRGPGLARLRVDGDQRVALVVEHPKGRSVVGRHDVLRFDPGGERPDDLFGCDIDDGDVVRQAVRYVGA